MADHPVTVHFYAYKGKPNVANKDLTNTDVCRHIKDKELYFITEGMPELTFDIESNERINANYISFLYQITVNPNEAQSIMTYWFVNSIEANKNIYIYHLQLDTIRTYWSTISGSTQLIERSSSILPSCYMHDTLWKTGKNLNFRVVDSIGSTRFFKTQSQLSPDSCVVVCCTKAVRQEVNGRRDIAGTGGVVCYLINGQEYQHFVASLYSENFVTAFQRVFKVRPMDAILHSKVFPFNVGDYVDGQEIHYSSSENEDIVIGNGTQLEYMLNGVITHPYAIALKSSTCEVPCGYIPITRPFGDFRDYEPFTHYKLWLPYMGLYDLDITPFYEGDGKLYIKYIVDIFSGKTTVVLSTKYYNIDYPIQFISGELGTSIPLGGLDVDEKLRNIGIAAVTAGITAIATRNPTLSFQAAGNQGNSIPYLSPNAGDNHPVPVGPQSVEPYGGPRFYGDYQPEPMESGKFSLTWHKSPYANLAKARSMGHFLNAFGSTPQSNLVNGGGDSTFMLLSPRPFLQIYTPSEVDTDINQNKLYGRLVMKTAELGTLTGFVKVSSCNLPMSGLQADVYNDLIDTLQNGFYIE